MSPARCACAARVAGRWACASRSSAPSKWYSITCACTGPAAARRTRSPPAVDAEVVGHPVPAFPAPGLASWRSRPIAGTLSPRRPSAPGHVHQRQHPWSRSHYLKAEVSMHPSDAGACITVHRSGLRRASPCRGSAAMPPRWRDTVSQRAAWGEGRPSDQAIIRALCPPRTSSRLAVRRAGPGAAPPAFHPGQPSGGHAVWGPAVSVAVTRVGPGAAAVLAHAGQSPPPPHVLAARCQPPYPGPGYTLRLRAAPAVGSGSGSVPRRDHHAGRDHRPGVRGRNLARATRRLVSVPRSPRAPARRPGTQEPPGRIGSSFELRRQREPLRVPVHGIRRCQGRETEFTVPDAAAVRRARLPVKGPHRQPAGRGLQQRRRGHRPYGQTYCCGLRLHLRLTTSTTGRSRVHGPDVDGFVTFQCRRTCRSRRPVDRAGSGIVSLSIGRAGLRRSEPAAGSPVSRSEPGTGSLQRFISARRAAACRLRWGELPGPRPARLPDIGAPASWRALPSWPSAAPERCSRPGASG